MFNALNFATANQPLFQPLINFDATLLFQIVNTIVLFSFLSWKLFKPVTATLEERKNKIAKSYEKADKVVAEANELKASYEQKMKALKDERNEVIANAKDIANKQADDIIKKAHEEAKLIKENIEKQAEAYKQKAMLEVKDDVTSMAVLAAAKILKKEVDSKANREMINQFIDGVGELQWDK